MRTRTVLTAIGCLAATLSSAAQQASDKSVIDINPPSKPGALAPNLAVLGDDVVVTWIEPSDTQVGEDGHGKSKRLRLAWLRPNLSWSGPITIRESDGFFANWADTPGVAVMDQDNGELAAWWLEKSGPDTFSYDVQIAFSGDRGASWKRRGKVHSDDTETEHGFVSAVPVEGGLQLFWLDGREMVTGDDGHGGGDMTLRTGFFDGRAMSGETVLDARVCECCGTSAAITATGPAIVFRDRSGSEVRDISIVRLTEDAWTQPESVHADNWKIFGCPVNGPAIAATNDNRVAVAWQTGANDDPHVSVSFSTDDGATFGEAFRVEGIRSLGRVGIVMLEESGDAIVSYLAEIGNHDAGIFLRRVSAEGAMSEPFEVARTTPTRTSGFPRMVKQGDRLILIWTVADQELRQRRLQAAAVSLDAI